MERKIRKERRWMIERSRNTGTQLVYVHEVLVPRCQGIPLREKLLQASNIPEILHRNWTIKAKKGSLDIPQIVSDRIKLVPLANVEQIGPRGTFGRYFQQP